MSKKFKNKQKLTIWLSICILIIHINIIFSSVSVTTSNNNTIDQNCTITDAQPGKPFPSLVQCYRDNPSSCCNSVADDEIKSIYSNLLSSSCYRKFPTLEAYFCYACSSSENQNTSPDTKTIRICKTFLRDVWGEDVNNYTKKYDSCGFKPVWDPTAKDNEIVLPSSKWANAYEFVRDVLPPFFEDYTMIVVDNEADPNAICFLQSQKIQIFVIIFICIFSIFFMFIYSI